jgi:hypothetical protein
MTFSAASANALQDMPRRDSRKASGESGFAGCHVPGDQRQRRARQRWPNETVFQYARSRPETDAGLA